MYSWCQQRCHRRTPKRLFLSSSPEASPHVSWVSRWRSLGSRFLSCFKVFSSQEPKQEKKHPGGWTPAGVPIMFCTRTYWPFNWTWQIVRAKGQAQHVLRTSLASEAGTWTPCGLLALLCSQRLSLLLSFPLPPPPRANLHSTPPQSLTPHFPQVVLGLSPPCHIAAFTETTPPSPSTQLLPSTQFTFEVPHPRHVNVGLARCPLSDMGFLYLCS